MSDTAQPQDVCYYGNDGRVYVYPTATGWTGRESGEPLRELQPIDPLVTFNWGYVGSGSNQVSRAILRDALGIDAPQYLYQSFTSDFVSQFPDEFRIRQGAVLRWIRGLACSAARHDFPEEVPPVNLHDKAYRVRRADPEGS